MPGKKGSGHGGCRQTHSPTKHPSSFTCLPAHLFCLPLTSAVPSGRAGDSPTITATCSGALARPACCARSPTPLAGSCSLPVLPLHPAPRHLWLPEARPSFGAKAPDCPRGPPSRRGRQPVLLLPSQGPGTPTRPVELGGGPISLPAQDPLSTTAPAQALLFSSPRAPLLPQRGSPVLPSPAHASGAARHSAAGAPATPPPVPHL